MRLIDADALREYLLYGGSNEYIYNTNDFLCEIDNAPTIDNWISVKDRMPEEHDSIFAKLIDSGKGSPAMFRKISDTVIVTGVYSDGEKWVSTSATHDGVWFIKTLYQEEVTHWLPMPEPPKED